MKIFSAFFKREFINPAAAFVSTAVLFAVLLCVSGCGLITDSASDWEDGDNLTFASKNNYERKDIFVGDAEGIPSDVDMKPDGNENTGGGFSPVNQGDNESPDEPDDSGRKPDDNIPGMPVSSENPPDSQAKDGTVRLRFIAAGDNIMHSNMIDDAKERAKDGENFNFRDMYNGVGDIIKSADIALVNVETPIAGDEFAYAGYPNFNTPKENGFALMDIGFDIVNIANNHTLDKGEKGYANHINFWESQDVLLIGGFKDADDFENIRIYRKDGVSIAFLSYTYGTNGLVLPKDSKMVIPYLDHATIERQVKTAKTLADVVFAVMHWGDENLFTANQQQRNLAQLMTDAGVDVIIGMHPHVFQETKWAARPDGRQTLVAYSIGNMISSMLAAKNMIGGFLEFDIVKTTAGGISDTVIENVRVIPVVTHHNMKRRGFQLYRFEDYTEDLAKAHGIINSDNKFSYKYLRTIIEENISSEFLSDFYRD